MDKKIQSTYIKLGLRDQKARRFRGAVQDVAMSLFIEYGYDAVTIDQIANEAGVSRSTLFRHFKTKESIVLYNSMGVSLADTFRQQPSSLTTLQALRQTFRQSFIQTGESGKRNTMRNQLIRTVPQVRAAMMSDVAENITMLAELIAERMKKTPDDTAVFTLASALMGISLGVLFEGNDDYLLRLDDALGQLETGWQI